MPFECLLLIYKICESSPIHNRPVEGFSFIEDVWKVSHPQKTYEKLLIHKRPLEGLPYIKDLCKVFNSYKTCLLSREGLWNVVHP